MENETPRKQLISTSTEFRKVDDDWNIIKRVRVDDIPAYLAEHPDDPDADEMDDYYYYCKYVWPDECAY